MAYYTYILKSVAFKKSYVGHTNSIERRLGEHNSGHHFYTKKYMPWVLLHIEEHASLEEAVAREKYLKTAAGRRWVGKNIFK